MKKSLCFISLVLASQGFASFLPAPRVGDSGYDDANGRAPASNPVYGSMKLGGVEVSFQSDDPMSAGNFVGTTVGVYNYLDQRPEKVGEFAQAGLRQISRNAGLFSANPSQQRVGYESHAALTYFNGGISEKPSLPALPAPALSEMPPAEPAHTTRTNGSASHPVRRSYTTVGQNASLKTKTLDNRGKVARGHTMSRGDQKKVQIKAVELPSNRRKRFAAEPIASDSAVQPPQSPVRSLQGPLSNGLEPSKGPTSGQSLLPGLPNGQTAVQTPDNNLNVGKMPSILAASSTGTGAPPPTPPTPPPPPAPDSALKLATATDPNNGPSGQLTASTNNNMAPKENSPQIAGKQQSADLLKAIRKGVTLKKVEESGTTSGAKRQGERNNGGAEESPTSTSLDQKGDKAKDATDAALKKLQQYVDASKEDRDLRKLHDTLKEVTDVAQWLKFGTFTTDAEALENEDNSELLKQAASDVNSLDGLTLSENSLTILKTAAEKGELPTSLHKIVEEALMEEERAKNLSSLISLALQYLEHQEAVSPTPDGASHGDSSKVAAVLERQIAKYYRLPSLAEKLALLNQRQADDESGFYGDSVKVEKLRDLLPKALLLSEMMETVKKTKEKLAAKLPVQNAAPQEVDSAKGEPVKQPLQAPKQQNVEATPKKFDDELKNKVTARRNTLSFHKPAAETPAEAPSRTSEGRDAEDVSSAPDNQAPEWQDPFANKELASVQQQSFKHVLKPRKVANGVKVIPEAAPVVGHVEEKSS